VGDQKNENKLGKIVKFFGDKAIDLVIFKLASWLFLNLIW
jgi:hypothetical protein